LNHPIGNWFSHRFQLKFLVVGLKTSLNAMDSNFELMDGYGNDTGWWLTYPLEKWMIIPNIWKNQIHVSNHQPVFVNRMRLPNGSNLTMLKDLKDLFSWLSQLWAQLYWSPFGHI
jgi:hypothetical protein